MVALSPQTVRAAVAWKLQAKGIDPLLEGVEAEGFGVGGGREEPTPALR